MEDHIDSINGHFVPGDIIIDVLKLEPVAVRSNTYILTDKSFPVHVKNIRKIDLTLTRQERRRSGRVRQRYAPRDVFELGDEEKNSILRSLKDANVAPR